MNEREPRALDPAGREPLELEPVEPGEERGFVLAFMGGAVRKGAWDPPERLYVLSCMGGVNLDFRDAAFLEGTTEVNVLSFMGGVSIIVPPGLDVDANGLGFLGGFSHLSQRAPEAGGPHLRIRGIGFMGGVDVKVKG